MIVEMPDVGWLAEGFGGCTNHKECEAACPMGISIDFIARLNRDYLKAVILRQDA